MSAISPTGIENLVDPGFATGIQGVLIGQKRGQQTREAPKKCEVTWCYNPQEDLTLFASTLIARRNKLIGRPVGRASFSRCPDVPTTTGRRCPRMSFSRRTLELSRTSRSIDMLLTRFRVTARLIFAATAGVVAASAMCASLAFAGGNNGAMFNGGGQARGEWQAVNRRAMRVDDVERGAQPFRYQRVAAGSGLTPISAEVRGGPRAEQGSQMRTGGSIRADIARYNEERTPSRTSGRQVDDPRSPANAAYRN